MSESKSFRYGISNPNDARERASGFDRPEEPGLDRQYGEHDVRHQQGMTAKVGDGDIWNVPGQRQDEVPASADLEMAKGYLDNLQLVRDVIESAGETIPDITDLQSLREMATRYRDQIIQRNKMKR